MPTDLWQPHEISGRDVGPVEDLLSDHEHVDSLLARHGVLVFRGFGVTEPGLAPVLDHLLPDRLAYVHGNSPRTKVGGNVYTSTEYPPEFTISMHNELSYSHAWPSRLLFYCARAPESGGATPVVDCAGWLAALDPDVREAFRGGIRYIQNLHDGFGLGKSWQDTFETGDRAEVDSFLDSTGADWSWQDDGGLRVSQVRPATTVHPVTGEEVWFNQVDQWHPAALGDDVAAELAELLPPEELPQSVTFADGEPIPAEHVLHVRERGLALAIDVAWAAGDFMLVDNVRAAHGRRPYTGPRRVLVAMSS